ncbi:hypothetical protein FBU31_003306, partial [Coemansia sp. 'formosensis']
MGKDLSAEFAASRRVFEEADETLGFSLSRMMFQGCPTTLMQTKNAQPAIVTVSVAALRALEHDTGMDASEIYSFSMGHSVGEYSALVAVQALSFSNCIQLVRTRGEAMQDAIRAREYAMSACILRNSKIEDVVAEVDRVQAEIMSMSHSNTATEDTSTSACEVVQVANINSSSQVVLSGTRSAVDAALACLQTKRLAMRAVNLPVSAPFHCKLMGPAKEVLAARIAELNPIRDPRLWTMPVISNVTAEPHETTASTQALLAEQVERP